jgi:hypothetical protein
MNAHARIASIVTGVSVALLHLMVSGVPAMAHPSDFETLTLDLLIGPRGLAVIDAAVVQSKGPSFEPIPTSEFKRDLAVDVLEALHVPLDSVEIDEEMSERYHEVGFLVRFDEPSLGARSALAIETADLQGIVAERALSYLKVNVCGVTEGAASPDRATLAEFDIVASRGPDGLAWCGEFWTLTPTDPSVSIVIKAQAMGDTTASGNAGAQDPSARGEGPGFGIVRAIGAAMIALFVGAAVVTVVARLWRRARPASNAPPEDHPVASQRDGVTGS